MVFHKNRKNHKFPVPDNGTSIVGVSGSLDSIWSVADFVPADVGLKVTVNE